MSLEASAFGVSLICLVDSSGDLGNPLSTVVQTGQRVAMVTLLWGNRAGTDRPHCRRLVFYLVSQ